MLIFKTNNSPLLYNVNCINNKVDRLVYKHNDIIYVVVFAWKVNNGIVNETFMEHKKIPDKCSWCTLMG